MSVTVVSRTSKGKEATKDKPAKPSFSYRKIITPATKRGGKSEASVYPTFADLASFLDGKIEIELDTDGNPKSSCLVSYAIEGWNMEANRNAAFAALNTPETAIAKVNLQLAEMSAKFGVSVEQLKAMLAATK